MRRVCFLSWIPLAFVACGDGVPSWPVLTNDVCNPALGYCAPTPIGTGGGSTTTSATSNASSASSTSSTNSASSSSSASSASSSGALSTSTLTGAVHRITSDAFVDTGTVFTGMATVALYPSTGPQITSSYDGATSSTFTANGVPDGTVWVAVLPTNPSASAAWATVSSVTTPQITAASVPIVDAPTLTAIASTLPSLGTKGVSATLTHVVLQLTHQGTPYAGVEVTGGTAGGVVAYDVATGTYSDSATATGAQGTALVLDASLSPGFATLTVTDPSTHKSWPVTLLTGTGAVTLVSVELD